MTDAPSPKSQADTSQTDRSQTERTAEALIRAEDARRTRREGSSSSPARIESSLANISAEVTAEALARREEEARAAAAPASHPRAR